ncbi:hypothetical protein SJAG_01071 [Schizosaccharomyces japonicus yFS275]|uniref:Conserved oligomeric Golgi complex subunit 4 n=1 Tax=Schizosaccharomyces japonicus (strain yFS275 / FY16936) TaxID=402676 RepID=B6JXE3_SCHJY|nr:hypothetical protein SJAG_01071 [Schizosaccharomyces japonicus yFS275]EEB06044.1 hypothetical protein SJAG_01071 [Schizosaccharomyces japonicus yFS275]
MDTTLELSGIQSSKDIDTVFEALKTKAENADHALASKVNEVKHLLEKQQSLQSILSRITRVVQDATELEVAFTETKDVDHRLIERIQQIDLEQNRAKECLLYVRQIKDFKRCLRDLGVAMERQHWEQAADCIHQANSTSSAIINSEFAKISVPSTEQPLVPVETLRQATDSLYTLFLREFQRAAREQDQRKITRFFKLFPLIGKDKEGVDAYWHIFGGLIAAKARATMDQPVSHVLFFSQAFAGLLEHVSTIINNHLPLVHRYYKAENAIDVIGKLQSDCDHQGTLIINTMLEERKTLQLIAQIRSYTYQSLKARLQGRVIPIEQREAEAVPLLTLHPVLNEHGSIFSRWNAYKQFISQLVWQLGRDEYKPGAPITIPEGTKVPLAPLFAKSRIEECLAQRLLSMQIEMERYYFRHSVEIALEMEEMDWSNMPFVSSLVDDVMYIAKQVLERLFYAGNAKLFCTFVDETFVKVLTDDFTTYVLSKENAMRTMPKNVVPRRGVSLKPSENHNNQLCALLNIASLVANFARRITDALRQNIQQVYGFGEDTFVVEKSLSKIDNFVKNFDRIQDRNLSIYFSTFVIPKINKLLFNSFGTVNYKMSLEEYSAVADAKRSNLAHLRPQWKKLTEFPEFTLENQTQLLELSCKEAAHILEEYLLKKFQWTEYGAMILESDISSAISIFVSDHQRYRSFFNKLQELLMLVVWESEKPDPQQVLNDLNLQEVNVNDVRTMLSRRVDS